MFREVVAYAFERGVKGDILVKSTLPTNPQMQPLKESYKCKTNCLTCMKGVVSKETVVLRRWGSSIQKCGFI